MYVRTPDKSPRFRTGRRGDPCPRRPADPIECESAQSDKSLTSFGSTEIAVGAGERESGRRGDLAFVVTTQSRYHPLVRFGPSELRLTVGRRWVNGGQHPRQPSPRGDLVSGSGTKTSPLGELASFASASIHNRLRLGGFELK